MTYVTSNQGRPIQGVSQQPPKNRYPGQCTLSENFRPDIVRGLTSRQGTYRLGELLGASMNPFSKWHYYVRNEEEYFIEIQPDGTVKAWSPDGTAHIVNVQDSANLYLADSNPMVSLDTKTIGDYTFLINRNKEVAESTGSSPALVNQAIVYIQFKDYSQFTDIFIDGTLVAQHRSATGGDSSHSKSVIPGTVAEKLYQTMQGVAYVQNDQGWYGGFPDITGTYNLVLKDNCIYISRIDGGSFTIRVEDDVDGANAIAIYKEIDKVSLLPNFAPANFKVQVKPPGGNTSENAAYWLQATTVDGSSGNNMTWNESIAPGIKLGMDKSTMPHVLVRESIAAGVATFTLRQGEWEEREVGDDRTNPLPSFVGDTIKSMGIMQNRLYFTSGESVIMSRSGNFFSFFRTTAQASLETDPIDIYADSEQINFLKASVGSDGDLVFFSEQAQFILPGDKALTASNAVLRKTTDFEASLNVRPVASGDNIFFAFNYGQYAGVREYFTDSVTDSKRARPVTDHVKEYIVGTPRIMVSSTNLNLLVIRADDESTLYVYDWLWQGAEKAQSAWGKILFDSGDKIRHMAFNDDQLRIIIERDGQTVECESVDLGDVDSEGLTFPVRLDRMQYLPMTKPADQPWEMTDPYPYVDVEDLVLVRSTGCYDEEKGTKVNFERSGGKLISYDDLAASGPVYVIAGRTYKCRYQPTNPVVKDKNGQAMNLDKLTVGAYYVNYNTTGDIRARVKDKYGNVRETEYGNRTLGGPENLIGFAPLVEGQHRIPIRKKSDQFELVLITESHIPLAIRDFSFNGNLNRRGQRI